MRAFDHAYFIYSFAFITFVACEFRSQVSLHKRIGDIDFLSHLDDQNFFLCDEMNIKQYFQHDKGTLFDGRNRAISNYFNAHFIQQDTFTTGMLRIRFIVNCQGQTDRFRTRAADENYNPIEMNVKVTEQLLHLTKNLKGWEKMNIEKEPIDYYQYLVFKLEKGKLVNIAP